MNYTYDSKSLVALRIMYAIILVLTSLVFWAIIAL